LLRIAEKRPELLLETLADCNQRGQTPLIFEKWGQIPLIRDDAMPVVTAGKGTVSPLAISETGVNRYFARHISFLLSHLQVSVGSLLHS